MPPSKFNVTRPDGSVTQVTPAQFERLSKLGYKKEEVEAAVSRETDKSNVEHYNSAGQTILTGLEGVASGATVGLSDLVIDGESTKARAKHNPAARIGGEVVGAVGAAVLSGGTSGAASIAAKTPAGLITRAAGSAGKAVGGVKGAATAGAIEGAVAGAGQSITRATLDGEPITADSIFAGAGWGAVYGAGITAGVSKISGLAEKSVTSTSKLADEAKKYANPVREDDFVRLKSAVEEFGGASPEISSRASASRGRSTALSKEISSIEKELAELDKVIPSTTKAVDTEFATSSKSVRRNHDKLSKTVDDEVKVIKKELGTITKTLNKEFDVLAKRNNHKEEFRIISKELAEMTDESAKARAIRDFSGSLPEDHPVLTLTQKFDELENTVKAKLDDLGIKGEEVEGSIWDLNNVRKQKLKDTQMLTDTQKEVAAARRSALQAELSKAEKAAEQYTIHETAIKALDKFPKNAAKFATMNPRKAEDLFGAIDALMQKSDDGLHALRDALNTHVDNIASNAGVTIDSSNPVDKLRKMYTLAKQADEGLRELSGKLAEEGAAKGRAKVGGFMDRVSRQAGARGASSAARNAGAGAIGSSVAYQAASYLAGGIGHVVAEMSGIRAAVQARVVAAVAKMNPTKNASVRHTIPRVQPLAMRLDGTFDKSTKDKKELAKARALEVAAASANMKEVLYNSLSPLVGEHTEFAAAMHKQGIAKFNALLEAIPRDPGTAFNNMKSMWSPNAIQVEQMSRLWQVFQNPIEVIEEFMADISTIDPIRTDALKKFYPDIYQDLRMQVVERVSALGDLDYPNQARLSNLLDLNLHSSFASQAVAARQAIYMEVPEESAMDSKSPNPAGRSGGRPSKSEPPTPGQSLQGHA